MAGRVYTVRFGRVLGSAGEQLVLYTAPEGYVSEIRDVLFFNGDAQQQRFQLYIRSGTSLYNYIVDTVPSSTSYHVECRQVIDPGDQVIVTSPGVSWSCAVTGYELGE